jgi:hypothetical protein
VAGPSRRESRVSHLMQIEDELSQIFDTARAQITHICQ